MRPGEGGSPVERLFARACFGRAAPPEDRAGLAAWLAEAGLEGAAAEAILAAPRRLGLYRKLLRGNVAGVCSSILPVTERHAERVAPGLFADTLEAFLAEVGPSTPHLRDVPAELVAFAAPRWRTASARAVPPWLPELAEVEALDFLVATAARPPVTFELAPVGVDKPLVLAAEVRLARFTHAVHHTLRGDDAAAPAPGDVILLTYRDAEHVTRFLDLTPLAGRILERALAGDPLGAALAGACADDGRALDDEVLAGLARLLADLGERGVLLGARA